MLDSLLHSVILMFLREDEAENKQASHLVSIFLGKFFLIRCIHPHVVASPLSLLHIYGVGVPNQGLRRLESVNSCHI